MSGCNVRSAPGTGMHPTTLYTPPSTPPPPPVGSLRNRTKSASAITRFARHAPFRERGEAEEKEKEDYTLRLVAIIV